MDAIRHPAESVRPTGRGAFGSGAWLTPEEDAIDDPDDEEDDDFDPTLPADLWFRSARRPAPR